MDKEEIQKLSEKITEVLNQEIKDPISEYQKLCEITAKKDFGSPTEEIMTWGLGITGEAGDVASCIKKTFAHHNDQKAGIRENLGDSLWYAAMICNFFDWQLSDILKENLSKLKQRYPEGFTSISAARGNTMIDWNEKR